MISLSDVVGHFESISFTLDNDEKIKNKILTIISDNIGVSIDKLQEFTGKMRFYIKKDGIYVDFSEVIKDICFKYNINDNLTEDNLKIFFESADRIKKPIHFKSLPEVFHGLYKVAIKYKNRHIESEKKPFREIKTILRNDYMKLLPETEAFIKAKKEYYNYNVSDEAKKKCSKDFLELVKEDLQLVFKLMNSQKRNIDGLDMYINLDYIYYLTTMSIVSSNSVNKENILYVKKYLEYINGRIEDGFIKVRVGINIRNLSVVDIIEYIKKYDEMNNEFDNESKDAFECYHDLKEHTVRNLSNINRKIFIKADFSLVREKLGEYIKYSDIPVKSKTEKERMELLRRKSLYFDQLDCDRVLQGVDKYDGYWGFVYNGKVVLERFMKNDKRLVVAFEDAIYIIDEKDFERIIKRPKMEVIEMITNGELEATRVYHSKNWEEKLDKLIKVKRS